ncbi:MAG: hypothetical protein ACJ75H_22360 [Thermoanaerobaculia bacterium]
MKLRMSLSFPALCLAMIFLSAQLGSAQALQPLQPQEPAWLTQMYAEGWHKVQEGVLQRTAEEGTLETFTYGEEGLRWTVESLKKQIYPLQLLYNEHPSQELADNLEILRNQLSVAMARLNSGQVEAPSAEQMENCDFSMGAHVNATWLTGPGAQGVTANADAYFHSINCGYLGNTYANVTVEGANGTVFTFKSQEDPKSGSSWLDSAVQLSLGVSSQCKSTAYARTWSDSPSFGYEATQIINYACPPPPPQPFDVTISGPSNVYTDTYTPCANATWTANATGGYPGYTFYWYINGAYEGSGSQLTKQYCYTNATVNVSVTGYDSGGSAPDTASMTTYVSYYEDYCASHPRTCECDSYYCGGCTTRFCPIEP